MTTFINLHDHMARTCECGSSSWSLLRSGGIECASCLERMPSARWQASAREVANESQAAIDVFAERRRQIESEGWAPEHDDEHSKGQLAAAAACYALSSIGIKGNEDVQIRFWPWDDGWWRPSSRRRDLVKAGALILAEIERIDRAEERRVKA